MRRLVGVDGLLRRPRTMAAAISVTSGALVMFATRGGPRLSPDSITYLAAADHLHNAVGLSDFTREPLSVFPPMYPVLLAPFGSSLLWVRVVGAASLAAVCWLLHLLLDRRVRPAIALPAVAAVGVSFGMVLVSSSTVSEPVCIALSLATLVVLRRDDLTLRWCAIGGLIAALAFLTRYAAVGTILAAVIVVAISTRRWRPVLVTAGTAGAVSAAWLVRNVVRSGEPMGPRFAGGAHETLAVIVQAPLKSIGIASGVPETSSLTTVVGLVVVGVTLAGAVVAIRRRPLSAIDMGMVSLAVFAVALPVVARLRTASDVSPRVMTPLLACTCYLGALAVDAVWHRRGLRLPIAALTAASVLWVGWHGVAYAHGFPDLASSGDRSLYSEALYDAIDELPPDTRVLTNNPWGVWWQSRREPIEMAFTRPRVGNSHVPVTAAEMTRMVCTGPTSLAWFTELMNAGEGITERRPDLLEVFDLTPTATVPGGVLYDISLHDPSTCDQVPG